MVVSYSRRSLETKLGSESLVSGPQMAKQAPMPGPMSSLAWPVWGEQVRSAGIIFLVGSAPIPNLRG